MNIRKSLQHSLMTLALAATGTTAIVTASRAVNLGMSVWTPLAGTTAAARPELAGVVILDNMVPLKVQFTNTDGVKKIWTGKLQNRIVQERSALTGGPGHLTFYYRIISDATNTVNIYGLTM